MTDTVLRDAINAWQWLSDPANSEALKPIQKPDENDTLVDDSPFVGDAFIPLDARRFSVNAFHKKVFAGLTKPEINNILELLQEAGIVGVCFQEFGKGRPKEFRHISANWLSENSENSELKIKATKMLTKVLYRRQANDYSEQVADKTPETVDIALPTEVQATETSSTTEKPTTNQPDPAIELALNIYDWIIDPENHEIDSSLRRYFSVERVRRDLTLERPKLEKALTILEQQLVISRHNIDKKGREIRMIQAPWLNHGREKLSSVLKPEPPKPFVPHGPARVLRTVSVYIGRLFMTFKEGEIVRDEGQISALLKAGAVLAKLNDPSARMCANAKCQHRFAASESATLDYPILEALRGDEIYFGGATFNVKENDIIIDRGRCLSLTRPDMRDRIKNTFRELPPDAFICCPKCKHVSKKSLADLRLEKK